MSISHKEQRAVARVLPMSVGSQRRNREVEPPAAQRSREKELPSN